MSWESVLKNPARKKAKVTESGDVTTGKYVIEINSYEGRLLDALTDNAETDKILRKVKNGELKAGSVRRAINRLSKLFGLGEDEQRMAFDKIPTVDVPVQSTVKINAEKILDELPASQYEKGSTYNTKRKVSTVSVKKYEDFMKGNHQQLIDFLTQGTADAKERRQREIRQWNNENNDRLVKYLKGAKANKEHLMGYDTEGITLKLAKLPPGSKKKGVEEIPEGFEITLGPFMSISNRKKYGGGEPSSPIKRNFFARLFNQPKYRTKTVATVVEGVDVQEVSNDIAKEYLGLVLHRLSGGARNKFLPEIAHAEDSSIIYGTKASAKTSTSKLLPALSYLIDNPTFQLEGSFAKEQTKESIQKKSVIDKLINDELNYAPYTELQTKFNEIVKPARKKHRDSPSEARIKISDFLKEVAKDTILTNVFNELVGKTVVRKYSMPTELRETLLASKANIDMDIVRRHGLDNVFPSKRSIGRMGKSVKEALTNMRVGKLEGTHEVMPDDVKVLQHLFTDVIDNPFESFIDEIKDKKIVSRREFRKEFEKMDTNVLNFTDVVGLIARLERIFFDTFEVRKGITAIYRAVKHDGDYTEASKKLKAEINEVYSKVRNEFVSKLKEKIGEVLSEPIIHDKSGFQPYEWLTEEKGIGS